MCCDVVCECMRVVLGDDDVEAHARLARRWDELLLYVEEELDNREWASHELARLLPRSPSSSQPVSPTISSSPVVAEAGLKKRKRSCFDDSDDWSQE